MILVIDIGNTNIVLGIYKEERLLHLWRVSTNAKATSDEYFVMIHNLLHLHNIDPKMIQNTVIGSVVTPLESVFQDVSKRLTGENCYVVSVDSFPDMEIKIDNPKEVGADRLLNASAGFDIYKSPLIIIDFGTATTFDVISEKGEYLGGAIAPGLMLSLDALTEKAFKLPRIDLEKPPLVVGKNTPHCMQSGVVFGYAGMVDSMVERISKELGYQLKVIATGGLAKLIQPVSLTIEEVVDDLTLSGLFMISKKIGK